MTRSVRPSDPRRRFAAAAALGLALALALAAAGAAEQGAELEPLAGEAAERFLAAAEVGDITPIGTGVTRPMRATLSLDGRRARAAWKTIDEFVPVKDFRDGGPLEFNFRDSYKHEIAAYELDKLLGLGLVPPTIERRIRRQRGSLQLWIEDAMTEAERIDRGLSPPDVKAWNRQIYEVRVMRQLTADRDFNQINNLVVDSEFRIWTVDYSRAFKSSDKLLAEGDLDRFTRRSLDGLERLDAELIDERLGKWLTPLQRQALLARRDLILERARSEIAAHGEAAVVLP